MSNNELNTEQLILEAAEAEFLKKGYGNTKMMAIARRANVSHSMLHYYFRNKENLFQMVFVEKAKTLLPLFEDIFEQNLLFTETIRLLVETQFDFITKNPKLPFFIITEILSNLDNQRLLFDVLSTKALNIWVKFEYGLNKEITKGLARPISIYDLIINIVAINVSTFVAMPILQNAMVQSNPSNIKKILKERKENNVQFILSALRP